VKESNRKYIDTRRDFGSRCFCIEWSHYTSIESGQSAGVTHRGSAKNKRTTAHRTGGANSHLNGSSDYK
jgi:hypothetical protein